MPNFSRFFERLNERKHKICVPSLTSDLTVFTIPLQEFDYIVQDGRCHNKDPKNLEGTVS